MNKKNTKFVQITNIFLLFRSFNLNKFCVLFLFIYISTHTFKVRISCVYIYIYIYIYINLPVNVIVRLPHPRSGDSQGQESF